MQFEGSALTAILTSQYETVSIHNRFGYAERDVQPMKALWFTEHGSWVGIGNRRRIRYLRPRTTLFRLSAGSQTTERVRNDWGVIIGAPRSGVCHRAGRESGC
jgi:hypothetical protein